MMRNKKTAENKNEGVIHRYITEIEKETNRDTLEILKEEFSYDILPVDME